jgi:hypothetical protein
MLSVESTSSDRSNTMARGFEILFHEWKDPLIRSIQTYQRPEMSHPNSKGTLRINDTAQRQEHNQEVSSAASCTQCLPDDEKGCVAQVVKSNDIHHDQAARMQRGDCIKKSPGCRWDHNTATEAVILALKRAVEVSSCNFSLC